MVARIGHVVAAALAVAGLGVAGASSSATAGTSGQRPGEQASAPVPTTPAVVERTLRDPRIVESSGLARSGYVKGLLWTHNDSGGGPYLYAVDKSGATVGRYRVAGAPAYDWEAMAGAKRRGKSFLFVGDIGDNASQRLRRCSASLRHDDLVRTGVRTKSSCHRSSILVHRVREPRPAKGSGTLRAKTYEFRYPDGAHNSETLMVKPGSMRIYVVTKTRQGPGGIYVAPKRPSTKHVNVLRRVADAPTGLPDGVFLDRHAFVLRGYVNAGYYSRIGAKPVTFRMPLKGESVTRGWSRRYILVGAEGRDSQVWRVRLP